MATKLQALADFRQALRMDPNVKRQFLPAATDTPTLARPQPTPAGAVLEDKEFLKQLFFPEM